MEAMGDVTTRIAEFIAKTKYADVPELAVARAVDAMTDCVGVAFAGANDPMVGILRATLEEGLDGVSEVGQSVIFGSDRGCGVLDAALVNGTMAHAIDYDDTAHPSYSHPSSHLFPALLALGALRGSSGRDLVTAYSVGLEFEGKLGQAMNFGHYGKGWHASGTFGTMATAAACANLISLSVEETRRALAIAASCASGVRANFGTMTKPLHAGNAARNGLYAVLLASKGFTATESVFTDRSGFFALFKGETPVDETKFEQLGDPWEVLSPIGLALKAYPACGATHPAIEAAALLSTELEPARISRVRVGVTEQAPQILVYDNPESALHGKFSMQYCVASALLTGTVNRATFTEEARTREDLQSLILKVAMEVDDRVRKSSEFSAIVSVTMEDGSVHEREVELARGKPSRWLTSEELFAKFADCTYPHRGQGESRELFDLLQAMTSVADVRSVASALC